MRATHLLLLCLFLSISMALALKLAAARAANPDLRGRVTAWTTAFNGHDVRKTMSFYAQDAVWAQVTPNGWTDTTSRREHEQQIERHFTGFPDLKLGISRGLERPGMVISEVVMTGTQKPTGKKAGVRGIITMWFDDQGLIKREETLFDQMTIAQQLGEVKAPPIRPVPNLPARTEWVVARPGDEKLVEVAKATWPATWNRKDRKGYDAVLRDDSLHAELASPNDFKGRPALLAEYDLYARALPDNHIEIENGWAFGKVVVLKFVFRGTMRGDIPPFRATGKPLAIHGVDVDELDGGKLAAAWTYSNGVELMNYLGVLPPRQP
jgi:ketosteroid isomerase-like protein